MNHAHTAVLAHAMQLRKRNEIVKFSNFLIRTPFIAPLHFEMNHAS